MSNSSSTSSSISSASSKKSSFSSTSQNPSLLSDYETATEPEDEYRNYKLKLENISDNDVNDNLLMNNTDYSNNHNTTNNQNNNYNYGSIPMGMNNSFTYNSSLGLGMSMNMDMNINMNSINMNMDMGLPMSMNGFNNIDLNNTPHDLNMLDMNDNSTQQTPQSTATTTTTTTTTTTNTSSAHNLSRQTSTEDPGDVDDEDLDIEEKPSFNTDLNTSKKRSYSELRQDTPKAIPYPQVNASNNINKHTQVPQTEKTRAKPQKRIRKKSTVSTTSSSTSSNSTPQIPKAENTNSTITSSITSGLPKKKHNEIEKRYRMNINYKIAQLMDLVPMANRNINFNTTIKGTNSNGPESDEKKLNKAQVLDLANDYFSNLIKDYQELKQINAMNEMEIINLRNQLKNALEK